jgi:nucleotide-binding universal stress UspA family protein
MMFNRILVPLDGSPVAEHALDTAADLAHRAGATLLLAHANTPDNYIYVEGMPVVDEAGNTLYGTHEHEYLRRMSKRARESHALNTEIRVLEHTGSSSAEMLADYIAEAHADLVIMTTHGRGGMERLWLGSVADALVRTTHVPILLLRPDGPGSILASIHRVLVPLDGSALADKVLTKGLQLAELLGVPLDLMTVVPVSVGMTVSPYGAPGMAQDASFERRMEEAQNYLDSTAKTLPPHAGKVKTHVAVSGHVANSIIETAQNAPGTLIAMTTHARRGLQKLFLGSVADKIVRASNGPVLLYRPGGKH